MKVGVLLVFDLCCRKTFENIPAWMAEAKLHIEPHRAAYILVGCKLDLKDQREVSAEEASRFAEENEMPFLETSAKTGNNKHCVLFSKILQVTSHIYRWKRWRSVQSCWTRGLWSSAIRRVFHSRRMGWSEGWLSKSRPWLRSRWSGSCSINVLLLATKPNCQVPVHERYVVNFTWMIPVQRRIVSMFSSSRLGVCTLQF